MNKEYLAKVSLGFVVLFTLSIFMVVAQIDSFNVDAWGFSSGGEIVNNYYTTYSDVPNMSLFNGNRYFFDEFCDATLANAAARTMSKSNVVVMTAGGNFNKEGGSQSHPCLGTISVSASSSGASIQPSWVGTARAGMYYEAVFAQSRMNRNATFSLIGFHDAQVNAVAPVDGVYFNISDRCGNATACRTNSRVLAIVRNNNVRTQSPIEFNLTRNISQYYKFRIEIINTTFANFTVYNSTDIDGLGNTNLIWNTSINTSLPSNESRQYLANYMHWVNGSETANTKLSNIDYYMVYDPQVIVR
jgi:hypothetical protein